EGAYVDHPGTGLPDELIAHLVSLWRELLDGKGEDDAVEIGPHTNFFVRGGHSLLGIILLARVEESTGRKLRLADLFKCPTPARLAERIRASDSPVVTSP
ncbi:phosphopantetheine-binding protein, partial [Streptomyces sp. NPDC006356]